LTCLPLFFFSFEWTHNQFGFFLRFRVTGGSSPWRPAPGTFFPALLQARFLFPPSSFFVFLEGGVPLGFPLPKGSQSFVSSRSPSSSLSPALPFGSLFFTSAFSEVRPNLFKDDCQGVPPLSLIKSIPALSPPIYFLPD